MLCTPCTDIHQLYIVLLSLPEAFIPQRVSKNKLRHVKNSRSLSEQTLIQIRRHPICQIERSSRKLFKMEDFDREQNKDVMPDSKWVPDCKSTFQTLIGSQNKDVMPDRKWDPDCKSAFLQGLVGVHQADQTVGVDQVTPD